MQYPKTVPEILKAKAKLEADILSLVKEFEFETATSVDQILCWSANDRPGQNRIKARALINEFADEVQIVSTETAEVAKA